eukprot:CAMPEP_0115275594 /NCGR_PEP_ID=MMETSP0270-20121206/56279_1 /TAXON_ID=71861 /ORGANISM="Scrippsiella trochoidea, Strain CCMP3099" /LENGTH=104 /DNA_ID=CAMNT_0002692157 /DNA_START=368 /DNA_END=682 /DNA_ORIENTATION=-
MPDAYILHMVVGIFVGGKVWTKGLELASDTKLKASSCTGAAALGASNTVSSATATSAATFATESAKTGAAKTTRKMQASDARHRRLEPRDPGRASNLGISALGV